jgi:hypothetical protein
VGDGGEGGVASRGRRVVRRRHARYRAVSGDPGPGIPVDGDARGPRREGSSGSARSRATRMPDGDAAPDRLRTIGRRTWAPSRPHHDPLRYLLGWNLSASLGASIVIACASPDLSAVPRLDALACVVAGSVGTGVPSPPLRASSAASCQSTQAQRAPHDSSDAFVESVTRRARTLDDGVAAHSRVAWAATSAVQIDGLAARG